MDPYVEEHLLPPIEALLAGTLALMTGYSQYLQAEANPSHRIRMGEKISQNLTVLAEHPLLSTGCRCVLGQLQQRWAGMANCTLLAGSGSEAGFGVTSTTLQ